MMNIYDWARPVWGSVTMPNTVQEIYFYLALAVLVVKVAWSFLGYIGRTIWRGFLRFAVTSSRLVKIELGEYNELEPSPLAVRCQFVRFGSDQYVKEMADDHERYLARVRNTIIESKMANEKGTYILTVRLPVHKRLGTQFKMFMPVNDPGHAEKVTAFLGSLKNVDAAKYSASHYPARVDFLLKQFDTVKTVEGYTNNVFYVDRPTRRFF